MPSIPFKKSRTLPGTDPVKQTMSGSTITSSGGFLGAQWTASEGHGWHMKPRPQGDIGGEFCTVKFNIDRHTPVDLHVGFADQRIKGTMYPFNNPGYRLGVKYGPDPNSPSGIRINDAYPDPASTDSFLISQGTIAVDRCSPVNSIAAVATTIGELKRDGLPSMPATAAWRERSLSAKNAGDDYLNYVFGWAPLLSDIKNFAKAASQSGKILSQLERDSGRLVRRRYEFPIESSTDLIEEVWDAPYPAPPYYFWSSGEWGLRKTYRTLTRRRWFSGAFTYYLPTGGSAFDRVARGYLEFDKLFGIGIDPETLWNLTPWSWATDWAFNTGSVLANLSDAAQYGLVMPYGYIMEETSVTYDHTMYNLVTREGVHVRPQLTLTHTVKKRLRASPFGFGLSWDGLSQSQLAILGALGITRNARK